MFRFLMTGALTVVLTTGGFAVAGAAESAAPTAVTVATAAADAAPAAQAATVKAAVAVEPAAPTAGADLAMWGVAPAKAQAEEQPKSTNLVKRFADGIIHRSATLAANLTKNAMKFLGVPYVFGGTSTSGFDCSGYVQHVFAMLGYHIPRTADAQYYAGKKVTGANIVPGDLVFFTTYERGPSHVGIYLGNNRFVHASSSQGVMVSSLHDSYWSARYIGAKRLI